MRKGFFIRDGTEQEGLHICLYYIIEEELQYE